MSHGNGDASAIATDPIIVPGFDISWAGGRPWPWTPGYCFGSEDGRILFTDLDGGGHDAPYEIAPSGEAINGVAFAGDLMAASTRSDVTFWSVPRPGEGHVERAVFSSGAHGVAATQTGGFVAPMGRRGMLVMGPKQAGAQRVKVLKPGNEPLDFYRVVSLAGPGRGEIFACAARRSGFAAIPLVEGRPKSFGKKLTPAGVDFVDVAPLAVDGHPFAVAALGRDCSIYLISDLSSDNKVKTLRYDEVSERGYRILCVQGHVLLLTNRALYVFLGLASRFLAGEMIDSPTSIREVPLEAVDASLACDGSLLVVMTDSVERMRIASLVAGGDRTDLSRPSQGELAGKIRPRVIDNPPWEPFASPAWGQVEELELATVA